MGDVYFLLAARAASNWLGGMSELAEGARLEIVYTPKAYPGFKSPSLRHLSWFDITSRRGGRAVECGGLENRFTGNPGNQGSNPCLSAMSINAPTGAFCMSGAIPRIRTRGPYSTTG